MIAYNIIGYAAAGVALIHLAHHLVQTVIFKKKVVAQTRDMVLILVPQLLIVVYSFLLYNVPLIVYFTVILLWTVFGLLDRISRRHAIAHQKVRGRK